MAKKASDTFLVREGPMAENEDIPTAGKPSWGPRAVVLVLVLGVGRSMHCPGAAGSCPKTG